MGIYLHTDNPAACFNAFVPGKRPAQDSVMFVGSVDGVRFAGTLRADGDYTVQSAPVNLKVTHAPPGRSSTQPARFLAYAIGLNSCIPVNLSALISGLKESMRRVPKDAPVPTHSICVERDYFEK